MLIRFLKYSMVVLTVFTSCIKYAYAQPDQDAFIPCHHAPLKFHQRNSPTEQEIAMMENSNKRSDSIDIRHYSIDIDVTNYAGKAIKANTTVLFVPQMEGIQWIQLDLKGLNVDSIIFENKLATFNYDGNLITTFFGKDLKKGQEYSLIVYYNGVPTRDPVWGGFYFVDDYIYNLGIGLSTTPPNFGKVWFPCFDNFVERTTFDYYVTTTSDKRAYCVGTFVKEDTISANRIRRHYHMGAPITTYLSSIAAANYTVSKSTHPGVFRDIPVELISKPADLNQMVSQFEKIGTALDAYEYWFGPYRFERVGYVATTVGAMEHPTNVAYPISTIQSGTLIQNEKLYGHELGHHWWGDITTLDDARDMWIKEGTAEYASHLFIERAYGENEFREAVKSNLSYILFNAHKNDGGLFLPLSPMPYEHTYGTHTYRKGAAMIHNMRGYMGDEEFRRMSTMVFDSMNGKSMNAFQFRDFLNRNSTVDMSSYFDDYIFNPGYNTFYMDSFVIENINNENYLNIGIAQKSYHAAHLYRDVPIIVSTYDKNLKRMEFNTTLGGPNSKVKFKLPADYIPTVVLLNENQKLNLATLQSQTIVKKTGPANVPYTAMTVNVSNFSDSSFVNIAHHLVGPDTDRKGTNIDRISSNHFWQVSIIQHGNLEIDGRIEYNGNDSASIDSDILFTSEDSLRLVYRQKPSDPWEDYPYYNKLIVNPTDRKGFVRITKLLPGDYALAHGYKVNVASHQTNHLNWNVFPNPASNLIKLSADVNFENHYYEVIDVHGKKVMSGQCSKEIVIESIPSGNYELAIYDQNRASIFQYAFIKL